jgi:DNA modification methylase
MNTWRILHGDVRAMLATIPECSVQCCVTSPPYWGLRDYGVDGQIGLESSMEEFVAVMVEVFRGVRRVLKDDGVCWVNLGDSYANGGSGGSSPKSTLQGYTGPVCKQALMNEKPISRPMPHGLKPKDLCGIPWRVALALQADGWWLRSDCIWHKPNPMPESVTDRPTKAHEYVFLLTKSASYYWDAEAASEIATNRAPGNVNRHKHDDGTALSRTKAGLVEIGARESRNTRTVWTIATQPYSGAHFATFPEELARRCIVAGSRAGDTVLDPFCGSGTTGSVAVGHGRDFIGCELNAEYIKLARKRIGGTAPLLAKELVQ